MNDFKLANFDDKTKNQHCQMNVGHFGHGRFGEGHCGLVQFGHKCVGHGYFGHERFGQFKNRGESDKLLLLTK